MSVRVRSPMDVLDARSALLSPSTYWRGDARPVVLYRCSMVGSAAWGQGDLGSVLGEYLADRLDAEARPMGVDVGDYLCCRRSSSDKSSAVSTADHARRLAI